ncbi:MAG: alpha-amylase family glycosyl hydrolase [Clostridia bacterium]|nr:alpha-amylase family glycosyl hydrolase [Clostridia bacterium]
MPKKIIASILMLCMVSSLLCSCADDKNENTSSQQSAEQTGFVYKDPLSELDASQSNDKYRNVYELLLYTYCDSNGDGIGDIQGLISKLDYLNDGDPNSGDDLGVDAIWLLPFTEANSYHKYDTLDYYTVDAEYGTMEDFKQLNEQCEERGIKIIMDLALNHISSQHEFFKKMCEEVAEGNTEGYAQMFSLVNSEDKPPYFAGVPDAENWWYECNFMPSFPELNLSSQMTRDEIEKIVKHWTEAGVDGFRLDGLKYYTSVNKDSSDKTDSVEFLSWLEQTAQKYNPDVYFVGELWDSSTNIRNHYESGIDSLFNFDGAGSTGKFANAIQTNNVFKLLSSMQRFQDTVIERNEEYIDALFLSNHDQVRIGTSLKESQQRKIAAALYMLTPGNSFIYYGEELGMAGSIPTQDASFRTAMIWRDSDDSDRTDPPPGYEVENIPDDGSVEKQLANENSILNFYRRLIRLKNINPEIARGRITNVISFDDGRQAAYVIECNGVKKIVLFNISKDEVQLSLPDGTLNDIMLYGDLYAMNSSDSDKLDINGNQITMPGCSIIILGEKQ